jgi:dolichol-phosphate mannosyltransferase
MNNSKSLIIIPTYNEKENVESIINTVLQLDSDFHVLIVDDGSPDGTAAIVKQMQLQNSKLFLLERNGKQGLGTAYIAGFKYGIQNGFDLIYEMDADFSHPPQKLTELKQACLNGADIAIGSRYVAGGKLENWPLDRILMSKGASIYVRLITGIPVRDTTAGFICYKRKVLETIDLDSIHFIGYAFQIEMKYKAHKAGFKLVEVPITFKDREKGKSKMSTAIFNEAFSGVWKMRFSND